MSNKNYSAVKFYAVLIGILAIVAASAIISTQYRAAKLSRASVPEVTASTQALTQANESVTGVKDERYTLPEIKIHPVREEPESEENTTDAEPVISRAEVFAAPVSGKIVKSYSDGQLVYSKTTDDRRAHTGADFACEVGDSVKAINNGTVKKIYTDGLWGSVIEIDLGDGMTARYCSVEPDKNIAEGSAVNISQTVGTLGEIPVEKSDASHLHLEILIDGKAVDPMQFFTNNNGDLD